MTDPPKTEAEVVDLVRALIRFDTSNTGDLATTKGEAECARWVAEQLQEVGYETEYIEAGAPGRANVFTRLKGADSSRGALMLHGHLDVVFAEASDWECAPVLRCPGGRLRLGSRRYRHEGHGPHDDRGRRHFRRAGTYRRATWRSRSCPTRRPAASTAASGRWTSGPTCSRE